MIKQVFPWLAALAACIGPPSRTPAQVVQLPVASAQFTGVAPCGVQAVLRAVPQAGAGMELEVEQAATGPGQPFVLRRGMRLNDPALWYRVDVVPAPAHQATSLIRVFAVPVPSVVVETAETIAKPAVLAMRIVAGCTAGAR
jgi:hypothetical protein